MPTEIPDTDKQISAEDYGDEHKPLQFTWLAIIATFGATLAAVMIYGWFVYGVSWLFS